MIQNIATPSRAHITPPKLTTHGYTVADVDIPEQTIGNLQNGLALIRDIKNSHALSGQQNTSNKDELGRLKVGYFSTLLHSMHQFNYSDTQDLVDDELLKSPNLRDFFRSLELVTKLARNKSMQYARAIDKDLAHSEYRDLYRSLSVENQFKNAGIVTSVMEYVPVANTAPTSFTLNTAALAGYVYATNPGMAIIDRNDKIHYLSALEGDRTKTLVVAGKELEQLTQEWIAASRHPIFPNNEGAHRFSVRWFMYLHQ